MRAEQRTSRNCPRGTVEPHNVSLDGARYMKLIAKKVYCQLLRTIYIQQDNATPRHATPRHIELLKLKTTTLQTRETTWDLTWSHTFSHQPVQTSISWTWGTFVQYSLFIMWIVHARGRSWLLACKVVFVTIIAKNLTIVFFCCSYVWSRLSIMVVAMGTSFHTLQKTDWSVRCTDERLDWREDVMDADDDVDNLVALFAAL
jgi:hypothetical protein